MINDARHVYVREEWRNSLLDSYYRQHGINRRHQPLVLPLPNPNRDPARRKRFYYNTLAVILLMFSFTFLILQLEEVVSFGTSLLGTTRKDSTSPGCAKSEISNLEEIYSACMVPEFDPYDKAISKYAKRIRLHKCTSLPSLTYVVREPNSCHTLIFNKSAIHYYVNEKYNIKCFYSLVRSKPVSNETYYVQKEESFQLEKEVDLDEKVTFCGDEDFVLVSCRAYLKASKGKKFGPDVYFNFHAFVKKKNEKYDAFKIGNPRNSSLSLLIIGIGSMSRANFIRTMPLTYNFTRTRGWVELKGYSKVGSTSFSNLAALLLGRAGTQSRDNCELNGGKPCPFLWKEFSQRGYATAFGEDDLMSPFYDGLPGFRSEPTDFYIRPLVHFAETSFRNHNIPGGHNSCLGFKALYQLVFEYAVDFANFIGDVPFFGMFWFNSFSRPDMNLPTAVDAEFEDFLGRLETTGILNKSLVLFLSERGPTRGSFLKSGMGWLEQRLPFGFVSVPHWFKSIHHQKQVNLEANAQKFLSSYDLYLTICEYLGVVPKDVTCPKCSSLFDVIPRYRSCPEAGVEKAFCVCTPEISLAI